MNAKARKKLESFLDIIASGEVPHTKIAELADVAVEDVAAFAASMKSKAESTPGPEAQAEVQDLPADAPPSVEPGVAVEDVAASSERSEAPPVVRALRKAHITDENGRPLHVRTRDVFTGARAAHIWARYPGLVEPYRPKTSE